MKQLIAAVILTKNEEKHIVRCLKSLKGICDDIVVVDCFSDDRTTELAKEHGARVIQHEWKIMPHSLITVFMNVALLQIGYGE